jgi:hypothetical protein
MIAQVGSGGESSALRPQHGQAPSAPCAEVQPEVCRIAVCSNLLCTARGELGPGDACRTQPALAHQASDTKGLSRELGSGRTRVELLGSCSGDGRRPPILKRFASKNAERIAGNEMALDVERVLDCGMNGQEPLR